MGFPAENSAAERLCKYLNEVGSATANEIKDATGLSYQTTARAYQEGYMSRIVGLGINGSYIYSLTPLMRDFLALGGKRYEGAIVPPRQAPAFKPWTGKYNIVNPRLQERSFHTCSGVPSPVWGYQA
jgi:hypothetical protein